MASSILLSDNGVSSGSAGIKTTGGNDGVLLLQTTTSGGTATTAVTIDTAQNVGVGVTPSAWNSAWKAIQIGQGANFVGRTGVVNQLQLIANAYFNGTNYIYQNTGEATQYFQTGGYHAWGIAPSGTAGNAITFTQAMTLDSSGNLLVGTTSNPAGVKLVIGGTSGTARIEPVTDNVGYIGEGSYRWQAVYAVNGTIQTSDGREKNTIADSNLGLSFVQSLRPVSYKWNVGENVVTYDEEGKEVVTPRPGVRTHYGFIAQEVKAAIPEGVDFGGFMQEPDEGMMSLRYHEFIGPLVKAIQEQQALITTLTERITALEGAK